MRRHAQWACLLLAPAIYHASSAFAAAPRSHSNQIHIPPRALTLAYHLGIRGAPVVGNQPEGNGGPWMIWQSMRRIAHRQSNGASVMVLQSVGQTLSSSPQGAQGRFDYFNQSALPGQGVGPDPYRGGTLERSAAASLARRWLQRAGVSLPSDRPAIYQERPGSTVVGGTGLCCFTALDVIIWKGMTVYVADAGTVVQADVRGRDLTHAHRCRDRTGSHSDSAGPFLGLHCFAYGQAAGTTMSMTIGGHSPWHGDPRQVATVFAVGNQLITSPDSPSVRLVRETRRYALFSSTGTRARYRITVTAAFPGLKGGVWLVTNVERYA